MNISSAILLVHSDEPDGSTIFPDASNYGNTITPQGNAQHLTSAAYFGSTGVSLQGGGDSLRVTPIATVFDHADGDFTYASWIKMRPNSLGHIFCSRQDATNGITIRNSGYNIQIYYGGGSGLLSSTSVVGTAVYTHLAVVRYNGTVTIYIDGQSSGSVSWSGVNVNSGCTLMRIGEWNSNYWLNADLDEILIADYAVWTADFDPPSTPYSIGQQVQLLTVQIFRTSLLFAQEQKINMAPRLYHQVTQILATARRLNLSHSQIFDTTIPIHLQQDQVFNNLAQVALLTTQVMRNYGAPVALEMLQTWAAYDYNLVYLPVVQLLGSQLDSVLQEIQFSVTVAASPVGIVDCDFDRKGFCNVATLLLRKRSEWANKLVGDPVVLTVLGEQYQMIVVNKPQDEQITQGTYEVGYMLECASITCQLAEGLNPDLAASRVTGTFPAGTLLTELLDFLTDGVCSYNLAVPDFSTGGYDFEDTERFAALREVLPEQYGWIIETDQTGVLQLRQWRKPEIGGAGQKTLTMQRKSLTPPSDTVYTQVIVRNYNQQDGTSGLRLEVVDNGDGTGIIYGYSVPWTDAFSIFDSEDSPAPSLLITGGAVEDVEVEDTDVEFVDFAASLSKPCYSDPVIDWGNNDSLSSVAYTESGAMTTATEPGYSVAVTVTYTTRRKKWTFNNRKIDVSQVRLRYD
jgi:hypothetical protein